MQSPIAKREIFIDRLLRSIAVEDRNIVDVLVDSRRRWKDLSKSTRGLNFCPITDDVIYYISRYLNLSYEETRKKIIGQLDLFNFEFAHDKEDKK